MQTPCERLYLHALLTTLHASLTSLLPPSRRHRRQVGSFRLGSAGSPDWSTAQRAESPALRWAATVASCVRTPTFTSRSSSEHRRTDTTPGVQRAEEEWRWRRGWC